MLGIDAGYRKEEGPSLGVRPGNGDVDRQRGPTSRGAARRLGLHAMGTCKVVLVDVSGTARVIVFMLIR